MYIHDVVASLREQYLKLANALDQHRMTDALIESTLNRMDFRLQVLEDMHPRRDREPSPHVSRETITEGEGNGTSSCA